MQNERSKEMQDKHINNYTTQAESARVDFLKWDQEKMIKRFNLKADDHFMYIDFFREMHSIDRHSGKVYSAAKNVPAGFYAIMSIYDVLCCSKAGAYLSGQWQTLTGLSAHSNFGSSGRNPFGLAAKKLSGNIGNLKDVCIRLGGQEATKADAGFVFEAFPFLPVVFQYWDGDDEFEPRIRFLFDKNTLDYIHFETAWYIVEHLLDRINTV